MTTDTNKRVDTTRRSVGGFAIDWRRGENKALALVPSLRVSTSTA